MEYVGSVGGLLATDYVLFNPDTWRTDERCARVLISVGTCTSTCDLCLPRLDCFDRIRWSGWMGTWGLLLIPNLDVNGTYVE